jgi:hypothetical protein
MAIYTKILFGKLPASKPKVNVNEAADDIFQKLFKEEIYRAGGRIKDRITDNHQVVKRDKLNLVIVSLYVFIVHYSASAVYKNSRTRDKLLKAFHEVVKREFNGYYDFITELAQKFGISYSQNPEEPMMGLGLLFSGYINEKNKNDVITAMAVTTETVKKIKLVTNYYSHLNNEFRI